MTGCENAAYNITKMGWGIDCSKNWRFKESNGLKNQYLFVYHLYKKMIFVIAL